MVTLELDFVQTELPSADDIHDESHYSIEDAKQKAEHDKMMKIAEEKKSAVRLQIAKLRTGDVRSCLCKLQS